MDSKYLIERGATDIAGFRHTVNGNIQKVWCAECAIAEQESVPFIAEETELALPDASSLAGSVGPVMYRTRDQHLELQGKDSEVTQDLTDESCDECGQSLQPE